MKIKPAIDIPDHREPPNEIETNEKEQTKEPRYFVHDYDLVLKLDASDLSEVKEINNFEDALLTALLPKHLRRDDFCWRYIHKKPKTEGVLLILDGYNELGEEEKTIVKKLLCGPQLLDTHIIVTCRLGAEELSFFDKCVEVTGFTKETEQDYINSFCKVYQVSEENKNHIEQSIPERQDSRDSISPIMLSFMCRILAADRHVQETSSTPMPTTTTQMYWKMVRSLMTKSTQTTGDKEASREHGRITSNEEAEHESLMKLCNIAWESMKRKDYNLSDDIDEVGEQVLHCGIMKMEKEDEEGPVNWSFFHPSLQAFLAALSIVHLDGQHNPTEADELLNDTVIDIEMVAMFVIGLLTQNICQKTKFQKCCKPPITQNISSTSEKQDICIKRARDVFKKLFEKYHDKSKDSSNVELRWPGWLLWCLHESSYNDLLVGDFKGIFRDKKPDTMTVAISEGAQLSALSTFLKKVSSPLATQYQIDFVSNIWKHIPEAYDLGDSLSKNGQKNVIFANITIALLSRILLVSSKDPASPVHFSELTIWHLEESEEKHVNLENIENVHIDSFSLKESTKEAEANKALVIFSKCVTQELKLHQVSIRKDTLWQCMRHRKFHYLELYNVECIADVEGSSIDQLVEVLKEGTNQNQDKFELVIKDDELKEHHLDSLFQNKEMRFLQAIMCSYTCTSFL